MEICRAVPADAATLTQIAHAAKRHWGYPEPWIVCWREQLTITSESFATREVWIARTNEGVAGFCAWLPSGRRARLEHLWVLPEFMGQGVGRTLFLHAAERARAAGWSVMEIVSDPHAEGFYLRLGARRLGEEPAEIDGASRALPVLELALDLGSRSKGS